MYDTCAGFAIKSKREAFVTRADKISLQIGAGTMSTNTFLQTFIYICREKVTHTIHLREYSDVGHIYNGRLIRQKVTELSTYECTNKLISFKQQQNSSDWMESSLSYQHTGRFFSQIHPDIEYT